ncbi:DUF3040 domain-containing protein [Pseudokineococcus basanitobsidens]|uniref:DUF3040 domain-containing protein n=1 Tax=Pseudokineococcus basanitobsidens TaxID=1926649 RepID=A0ABU8RHG7_9ACTN
MPLSEHEQRLLSQMEQQLLNDDPKFASAMKGSARRGGSAGRLLLGGAGILVGLLLLVVGVATQLTVVGVLAFVLMLGGAAWAISTPRRPSGPGPRGAVRTDGSTGPAPGQGRSTAPGPGRGARRSRPARGSSSFMERMEERWQKRRDEGGGGR